MSLTRAAGGAVVALFLASCLGIAEVEDDSRDAASGGATGIGGGGWLDAAPEGAAGAAPDPPSRIHPKQQGDLPPNSGDGYIGKPASTCQGGVHESVGCSGSECIVVGRDPPCGDQATYRAFLRFELGELAGVTPKSATLELYLYEKSGTTAPVSLLLVPDFVSLEESHWNLDGSAKKEWSNFLEPSTPIGPLTLDVTQEVLDALSAGDDAIAFMFVYGNESEIVSSSHWFGIVASEADQARPALALTY